MTFETENLMKNGHVIIEFKNLQALKKIQKIVEKNSIDNPTLWHSMDHSIEEHLSTVKKISEEIYQEDLVYQLIRDNEAPFIEVMGPDIDIQNKPHFRMSRPGLEEDFVDWHRDSYYGNSPWEVNFWFPLYALESTCGLTILKGSHLLPSKNIKNVEDKNEFRRTVEKGSMANSLGYTYAPKTEDLIENLDHSQIELISPKLGQGILFFGQCIHRAQNKSKLTRVSIDLRLRPYFASSGTKPGYYKKLCRGPVGNYVDTILSVK